MPSQDLCPPQVYQLVNSLVHSKPRGGTSRALGPLHARAGTHLLICSALDLAERASCTPFSSRGRGPRGTRWRPQRRKVRKPELGLGPSFPGPLLFVRQLIASPPRSRWEQAVPRTLTHTPSVRLPGRGHLMLMVCVLGRQAWWQEFSGSEGYKTGWTHAAPAEASVCRAPERRADHGRTPRLLPSVLAAPPEGSTLVIYFKALTKKAQPNHPGHLQPTVCISVQICRSLCPKEKTSGPV